MEIDSVLQALDDGTAAHKLESQVLDFKTEKPDFKSTAQDLADACVCFANADGGTVIVGISDKPSQTGSFVGTHLDATDLRLKIYSLTRPNLTVEVTEVNHNGVRLLRIDVPLGIDVYSTVRGQYFQRWTDQCQPMEPHNVARLTAERRGEDWSAASSGQSIEDVDPVALAKAVELLANSHDGPRELLSREEPRRLLAGLELLCADGSLTRAGALLFTSTRSFGPRELVSYQHRRTPAGEADAQRRWSGPLILVFDELMEAVNARIDSTPLTLSNGRQILLEDYPLSAVREALANAITHRDYSSPRPVSVIHSPQHFEVSSPGPLVTGITVDNLLSKGTRPRYPLLARTFNRFGWVEYLGQGFNRMFREMARIGKPLPQVRGNNDEVVIVLEGSAPNIHVARLVADLPNEVQVDTDSLLILMRLCEKKSVTASEIAILVQREREYSEKVLRRLSDPSIDLIEPTTGTRNRKFPSYRLRGAALARLGSAVAYHVRSVAESDRKVIEHVRDFESINNSALQRMFDIDVYTARDILKDLTTRNILVRTSEQSRGVSVRYGPGIAFPHTRKSSRAPIPRATEGRSDESLF